MAARHAPFVGRQRELDALLALLDAAAAGRGRLLLVAGEPGIGKTRLLGELAERATMRGWLVISGRAFDGDGLPPYLPFTDAFKTFLSGRTDAELRESLG